MKILPTMNKGIVFLHEDGKTFELAPMQVFMDASGQTLIRIGRNVLFFAKDGSFDGTESSVAGFETDSPEAAAIRKTFELQGAYKGLPPDEAYFQPGSAGFVAETRNWPKGAQEDPGRAYVVVPAKRDLDS